ncbi:LysR family transcriptional regulator (plasmid) [Burkholderia sp. FERM BP-3421]|uniref:LysR family transcriptional regulator n=1 Tax=Burkholderia sp. FERM BP-3421 TaxID=1494466 RepID=UPI00235F87C8|nr:LysR family transcriptional regulator [Burkholderia sp. FERM BP-3421]WDD90256.1 LysR family transcriptional regulator [Burkholderia sp. FERM BP-3421]
MNTRFLETLVVLARTRSIKATAVVLGTTSGAISQRIKNLEETFDGVLVERWHGTVRLTSLGEHVLPYVRSILEAEKDLIAALPAGSQHFGRLRLGVIETIVHSWLPEYLREFAVELPKVELDLSIDATTVLHQRLLADELDVIFRVGGSDDERMVSEVLADFPVRWIARSHLVDPLAHGLAKRVLAHPILTYGRGTAPYHAVSQITKSLAMSNGIAPQSIRITPSPSIEVIRQLVCDGYGVAAIPPLLVDELMADGSLVELPLDPSPPPIAVAMEWKLNHGSPITMAGASIARKVVERYGRSVGRGLINVL